MLCKAFNLQFCVLFMMLQGKVWITPEWGFWLTDLHESHKPSLLCKYQVVVELWMAPLCQQTASLSWACHCVLINRHGWKQGYKRLFRWWKPVYLPPISPPRTLFLFAETFGWSVPLFMSWQKSTPHLFQKLFIFPSAHTAEKWPLHSSSQPCIFERGLAQISYRPE